MLVKYVREGVYIQYMNCRGYFLFTMFTIGCGGKGPGKRFQY